MLSLYFYPVDPTIAQGVVALPLWTGGTPMVGPWINLLCDTAMLAVEAQTVIGIRLTRLSLGGPAALV